MAYSTDLRESAVKYFLSHNLRYKDVADIFDVSVSTLHGWVSLFKKGGCLDYRTSTGRPRLIDRDKDDDFRKIVVSNADHTLAQISETWEAHQGQKLSISGVSRAIRRLGLTRKKRLFAPPSEQVQPINKGAANTYHV